MEKNPCGCAADGGHAGHEAIADLFVARALPLGEPGRRHRAPIRAEAEPGVRRGGVRCLGFPASAGFAVGLDVNQGARGFDLLVHEVADAFVCGEIVEIPAVGGVADAQLFRAATPVQDVVP